MSASLLLDTLPAGAPRLSVGHEAMAWAMTYLRQPDGDRAGLPWRPTPRQVRFLLWFYAVDDDGRWLFNHAERRLAKGSGKSPSAAVVALIEFAGPCRVADIDGEVVKAKPVDLPLVEIAATAESQPLALDTPVPTPTGFTTIGDIRVGDQVFGSDGRPVDVVSVTPVLVGEPCYRVVFDDGEQVVASASHSWTVWRANSHNRKRSLVTVTTRQMASDTAQSGGTSRYSMPPVAVQFDHRPGLPVDPYLLGLWLGDGTTKDAAIAYDARHEAEVVKLVTQCLEPHDEIVINQGLPGNQGLLRVKMPDRLCRWGHRWDDDERFNGGDHVQCGHCLRERGKPRDREPLLTLRERLRAIGVLGRKHIPEVYLQSSECQRLALLQGLIDSDGYIDAKGRASFTNRDHGLVADVQRLVVSLGFKVSVLNDVTGAQRLFFVPRDGRVVARLSYKVARHRVSGAVGSSRRRYVRAVLPIESVPVRCIGISTADHLFVVGRHNTLTHNTANTMRMVRAMAPRGSRVVKEHHLDPGKTIYYKTDTGGELHIITSSAAAAEGSLSTFVVGDEREHWLPGNGGVELADVLDRNLAKSGSRMLATANAWQPGVDSVAEAAWDAWVAQQEGRVKGAGRILYDAVIAPPDVDLADEDSLMAALRFVYDDCEWVDKQVIRDRIWDPRTRPDVARRFYLNQPTAAVDSWTTPQAWAALAAPEVEVVDGDEVVLFFDGSKSRDATALVGCRVDDGHVFTVGVWEPTEGQEVSAIDVDAAVAWAFDRWTVVGFFADVREWESFVKVSWPQTYGDRLVIHAAPPGARDPQPIAWDMRGHVAEFTRAAELCEAEITDALFSHDGDSRVARHVGNARRRPNRHGVSVGKESKDSPRKIDAAVCVIGARMVRRMVLAARTRGETRTRKAPGTVRAF